MSQASPPDEDSKARLGATDFAGSPSPVRRAAWPVAVALGAAAIAGALWVGSGQLGPTLELPPERAEASRGPDTPVRDPARDAAIEASRTAIDAQDWKTAQRLLAPLVAANPADAEAQYNLGLANHRTGNYNAARSGYLRALRAKPNFPDARYNLAVLTWSRGVKDEARHHVAQFVAAWPDDPRGGELRALVGTAGP